MTSREGVLVLAPWGDPRGWVQARYVIGDSHVVSFTSLQSLAEMYGGARIVVLAADTVARGGASYGEVVENAREYIERFLCGISGVVEVLPGAIAAPGTVFRGSLADYYYRTLAVILERLRDSGAQRLVVDLTHGVNYMPSLTLKAAEEAAALAAFSHALSGGGSEVWLEVYNSDPLVLGVEQRRLLARSAEDPARKGISLGAIMRLQDSLRGSRVLWIIQGREREKLEKRIKEAELGGWVLLADLYGVQSGGECNRQVF